MPRLRERTFSSFEPASSPDEKVVTPISRPSATTGRSSTRKYQSGAASSSGVSGPREIQSPWGCPARWTTWMTPVAASSSTSPLWAHTVRPVRCASCRISIRLWRVP
ncbi:hypothetical protein IHE61_27135 [Streptomyces sp. GKU 257-1]|nr:hypothetical protein [Streptomyces sp. GKU 257-1]